MSRDYCGKLVILLILVTARDSWGASTVSATATLTISGTEQVVEGEWDTGTITVTFSGFTETVRVGQFSTPASIASGLAAMFCRDYMRRGLYAKAGANNNTDPTVITFQLLNGQTFNSMTVTGSSSSFQTTAAYQNGSTQGPQIVSVSPARAAVGTTVTITGMNLGTTGGITFNGVASPATMWTGSLITVLVPPYATSGPLVVSVGGVSSNSLKFTVSTAPPLCPVMQ